MIQLIIPSDHEGQLFAVLIKDDNNLPVRLERQGDEFAMFIKTQHPDTGVKGETEIGRMRAHWIDLWLNAQPS